VKPENYALYGTDLYSPLTGMRMEIPSSENIPANELIVRGKQSFENWANMSLWNRGEILHQAAENMIENKAKLNELVRLETGKTTQMVEAEFKAAHEMCQMMASFASQKLGRDVKVWHKPRGVALLFVSYNTPLPNFAWKVFPALMAGNSVILKPSPHNQLSAKTFINILNSSGIPEGVLQLARSDITYAHELLESEIDIFSFTGSAKNGLRLGALATERGIKTILELGGANPFIVFDYEILEDVVSNVIESAFSNAGQRCASTTRLLIRKELYNEINGEFFTQANKLTIGVSESSKIGPLISREAVENFDSYLQECKDAGAVVYQFGILESDSPFLVKPAMICGLPEDSELARCEIFAPAIRLSTFSNTKEAILKANSTEYGLTAAIWTRDSSLSRKVAAQIRAGLININGPTHGAEINMPFGGFGKSGNGTRDAGFNAIEQYSDLQVISEFFRE
jgi:aldehyde dehydrogenase (NAD+)